MRQLMNENYFYFSIQKTYQSDKWFHDDKKLRGLEKIEFQRAMIARQTNMRL